MIARFRVLLPFTISVRHGDSLAPQERQRAGYRVLIYPPMMARVDPQQLEGRAATPPRAVLDMLVPADPQPLSESELMDGSPTIPANLLQIDFLKPRFDREKKPILSPDELILKGDPPPALGFSLATDLLLRIRSVSRAYRVKPLSPLATYWRLDYLTDAGKELDADPSLSRRRMGAPVRWEVSGLHEEVWRNTESLPADFTPQAWDTLLLDAQSLLPEVGASIVLAHAALEVFIKWCLDRLAASSAVPPTLWAWINDRDRDWTRQPSVSERFDVLLESLGGRSLKEQPELWEAFQNLREARNNVVHQGKAAIGKDRAEVTSLKAEELVLRAQAIVDWVESLLPAGLRRVKLSKPVTWEFWKRIAAADE